MTKKDKKKQINTAFAMNLVIGFLALLMVGYMLTAGILLGKKTVQLEDKLDIIKHKKIAIEEVGIEKTQNNTICFNKNCFNIEIADSPEKRSQGLMFRESMKDSDAMLFVFEKELNYGFWMKDTLIPLDMIWLGKDKRVVYVADNVQPCGEENSVLNACPSYRTDTPALYVLEINAGLAESLGINIGDKPEFTTTQ